MFSSYQWRIIKIIAKITPKVTIIPVTKQKTRMTFFLILLDSPDSILLAFFFFVCVSKQKKYTVIIMFKFSNELSI